QVVSVELEETARGGSSIPVLFRIPGDCRQTQEIEKDKIEWHLTAIAKTRGVSFKADFLVPVFKTADSDSNKRQTTSA
ncbi:MAG TPA: hypothetical protein VGH74_05650, partial [Planctomycetaceae bacterium]